MDYTVRTPVCSCEHSITAHDLTSKGQRTVCSHHLCSCGAFRHAKDWVWESRHYVEVVPPSEDGSS